MMERENNYDLLRIVSAIAVISIHVSRTYLKAILDDAWLGGLYEKNMFINCVYHSLSRFAVPCFIMLSGAFTLDSEKNVDLKYYYSKIFKSLGITAVIVSAAYFQYALLKSVLGVVVRGREVSYIFVPIRNVIVGAPYYHLWYIYDDWHFYADTYCYYLEKYWWGGSICKNCNYFFPHSDAQPLD